MKRFQFIPGEKEPEPSSAPATEGLEIHLYWQFFEYPIHRLWSNVSRLFKENNADVRHGTR